LGRWAFTSFLSGPLGPKSLWLEAFGLLGKREWRTSALASCRSELAQRQVAGEVPQVVEEGVGLQLGSSRRLRGVDLALGALVTAEEFAGRV